MKQSFGDRSTFALELEWHPCERLADDGQRRTWASLTLVCQGVPLTRHQADGEPHEDVVAPASALATWIGRNWAALTGSRAELPGAEKARTGHDFLASLSDEEWEERERELDEWISRHSLLRVGQGVLLPNVILWNRGDCFVVSWRADAEPEAGRSIEFQATGSARVPPDAVLPVLQGFVRAVAERIEAADESSAVREQVLEASRAVLAWNADTARSSSASACSEDSLPSRYSPTPRKSK